MASFLVAGGAGFIGSNLVEAILRQGGHARVADDFSTGRRENLVEAPRWAAEGGGRYELLEGDIRDASFCAEAVRGVEFVLHQAAIPSVQRSVEDPLGTNAVNVTGTLNLLVAARDASVRRFVFASSSSVYGESEVLPKVETMPTAPISPYGLQKLAGETYCRIFHRIYALPTVALRYFNVFGPRQNPDSEYAAVVPRFLGALRAGQRPTVYGDGEQTRDFTYVENVVGANLLACRAADGALGEAVNVACGERVSLLRLLSILAALVGVEARPEHRPPRAGDIRHSEAGIGRAEALLGYRAEVGLEEGLARLVRTA